MMTRRDPEYEAMMMEKHRGLVGKVMQKYGGFHSEETALKSNDDLFQAGWIGLLKAVRSFDETLNFTFATYATKVVTNEIFMYLRRLRHQHEGEALSMDDMFVMRDGSTAAFADVIADPDSELAFEDMESMVLAQGINLHKIFTPVEYRIFTYVLNAEGKKKQNEIAAALGYSQSYIGRLLTRMQKKLRAALAGEHKIKNYRIA